MRCVSDSICFHVKEPVASESSQEENESAFQASQAVESTPPDTSIVKEEAAEKVEASEETKSPEPKQTEVEEEEKVKEPQPVEAEVDAEMELLTATLTETKSRSGRIRKPSRYILFSWL